MNITSSHIAPAMSCPLSFMFGVGGEGTHSVEDLESSPQSASYQLYAVGISFIFFPLNLSSLSQAPPWQLPALPAVPPCHPLLLQVSAAPQTPQACPCPRAFTHDASSPLPERPLPGLSLSLLIQEDAELPPAITAELPPVLSLLATRLFPPTPTVTTLKVGTVSRSHLCPQCPIWGLAPPRRCFGTVSWLPQP